VGAKPISGCIAWLDRALYDIQVEGLVAFSCWAKGHSGHFALLAERDRPSDGSTMDRNQLEVVKDCGTLRVGMEDEQSRPILDMNPWGPFVDVFGADVLVCGVGKPVQQDVVELLF